MEARSRGSMNGYYADAMQWERVTCSPYSWSSIVPTLEVGDVR